MPHIIWVLSLDTIIHISLLDLVSLVPIIWAESIYKIISTELDGKRQAGITHVTPASPRIDFTIIAGQVDTADNSKLAR